jgi:hypothetical protein
MCGVCRNQISTTTAILDCFNCQTISETPPLPHVKYLRCFGGTNLTIIPKLPEIQEIDCRGCVNLIKISAAPSLIRIDCSDCPKLEQIELCPELWLLWCRNCPKLRLPIFPRLFFFNTSLIPDYPYWTWGDHTTKLKIGVIQRRFRRKLGWRRLLLFCQLRKSLNPHFRDLLPIIADYL